MLTQYDAIDAARLRANHAAFLRAVCPIAEEVGVRLCIHPDDPPFPLFGLPKIASVADDFADDLGGVRFAREWHHFLLWLAGRARRPMTFPPSFGGSGIASTSYTYET